MADSPLPGWPDGPVHLLLQARLSPLPRAAEAWAEWQAHHTVDDAGWAEVRLLAGLAGTRHGTISDDLARRIDGLRKFVWARNSLRLDRSVRILDALAAADIPVMLLKGGARVALEPRALAARFLRDLDLLVPPDKHKGQPRDRHAHRSVPGRAVPHHHPDV
ncbi:MAG: nucleotidyltransferase family protein, partial [Rubricella sp.]